MAIDASQWLDRLDLVDIPVPTMSGRDVAAMTRRGRRVLLPIELRDWLTNAEQRSQKGA